MTIRNLTASLLLGACLLSAQQQPKAPAPRFSYVTPEQLNPVSILTAPPANESAETWKELAELHQLQETRTPAQIAHAQADDKEESMFSFADILGAKFTRAALPKTALLSDHVKSTEGVMVNPAKKTFRRSRPYHFDATLRPVCKTTENREDFGYPSGHGTTGYLEALTLAQLVPEKRDAILARAVDYALSREICGAHYAADERASKALSYAVFGMMWSNPQYRAELEAARTELRATLELK